MECEIIHYFQNKQDFSMFLSVNDFHKTIKTINKKKSYVFSCRYLPYLLSLHIFRKSTHIK